MWKVKRNQPICLCSCCKRSNSCKTSSSALAQAMAGAAEASRRDCSALENRHVSGRCPAFADPKWLNIKPKIDPKCLTKNMMPKKSTFFLDPKLKKLGSCFFNTQNSNTFFGRKINVASDQGTASWASATTSCSSLRRFHSSASSSRSRTSAASNISCSPRLWQKPTIRLSCFQEWTKILPNRKMMVEVWSTKLVVTTETQQVLLVPALGCYVLLALLQQTFRVLHLQRSVIWPTKWWFRQLQNVESTF